MYPGRSKAPIDRWQERENHYSSNQHSPSPGMRPGRALPANLSHLSVGRSSSYGNYDQRDTKDEIKYKGWNLSREHYIPVEEDNTEALLHKRSRATKGEKLIEEPSVTLEHFPLPRYSDLHPSVRPLAKGYPKAERKKKYAWRGQIEVVDQPFRTSYSRNSRDLTKEEKRIRNLKALQTNMEEPRKKNGTPAQKAVRIKGKNSALTRENRDQIFDAPELQGQQLNVKSKLSKIQAEVIPSDSVQRSNKEEIQTLHHDTNTQVSQINQYENVEFVDTNIESRIDYIDESRCMEEFANSKGLYNAEEVVKGIGSANDYRPSSMSRVGQVNRMQPNTTPSRNKLTAFSPHARGPVRTGQLGVGGVTTLHDGTQKVFGRAVVTPRQTDQEQFCINLGPASDPVLVSEQNGQSRQTVQQDQLRPQTPATGPTQQPKNSWETVPPEHLLSQIAKVFELSEEEVRQHARRHNGRLKDVVAYLSGQVTVGVCLASEGSKP